MAVPTSPIPGRTRKVSGRISKSPRKKSPKSIEKASRSISVDSKSIPIDSVSMNKSSSDSEIHEPTLQAGICKHLSNKEAMSKLKKKLIKAGIKEKLRPIAKGRPQFMLGMAQGRTRPLLHLYDTGCGSVLFREGVPQNELYGSTLTTPGPFTVQGVGGTSVTVNAEFMVTVALADGTRQVMEGWTMNKITDTLPFVNLKEAEDQIKSSHPDNKELQELKCQPSIGGDVDCLIGILYNSIQPEPVHSLENGLTCMEI